MIWTDDPSRDWDRYCIEQDKEIAKLPKCEICGEHITDDHLYHINDEFYCEDCLIRHCRKRTEYFIN